MYHLKYHDILHNSSLPKQRKDHLQQWSLDDDNHKNDLFQESLENTDHKGNKYKSKI